MTHLALSLLFGCFAHATANPRIRVRYTKNGGMRFLRIHKFQFSFCVCKNPL